MLGKNNNYMNQQKQGQKFEKYSIKKLKVGAASVLVGAGFFFGYHVEASEVTEPKTVVVTEQNNSVNQEISKPTLVENTLKTEVVSTPITEVVDTSKTQETPVSEKKTTVEASVEQKVQTTELQEKVSALQTEVNRIRSNEKQKLQIEQAEKLIEEAKSLQASKTATQKEVDTKAKEISSLTSILKSIKSEETVKENKNQDSRNGKKMEEGVGFRADTATGTGISADVKDATSTPAVTRDGYTDRAAAESFTKQVTWLDFGDVTHWQNVDNEGGKIYLKEGSIYKKEVISGYVINIKVKSLKPFQATEIYRKRMEAANASEEEKATFNPNATNQHFGAGSGPSRVTADQQDGTWSEVRNNGINTGNKKTSIGAGDWSNIGVQFEISATYKGKNVRPAVIMNDSESANHGENIILTTNGSPWERVLELKKERFVGGTFTPTPYKPINNYNLRHEDYPQSGGWNNANQLLDAMRDGLLTLADGTKFAPKYMTNPDQEMGGLGTGVFGPVTSSGGYSLPVLMTKDATEVGLYILSPGIQTAMMGVIPIDEGDAPESYGKASHTINTVNGVTGDEVKQPYLGSTRPDMDTGTTKDWYGDDKDSDADESVNQLLPDNLKDSEGNIIKANISKSGNYTLNVQAHTGGAEKAYIRSWIDFNKNGRFDADEASEIATITTDGTVKLNFKNKRSADVETLLEAGARVRIATEESEIENPTGTAFSGEVEDFIAKITHPPKGEKKTTIGNIKETQREEIHFTAQGKNVYLEDHPNAEIDTTVQPTYIDNKTGQEVTLASDGTYTVEGEGTYKFAVSDNGKDVKVEFTPADGFVGKAHGITIRRQDTNKTTTEWGTPDAATLPNVNDSLNTMDGLYIPEVTVPTSVEATPINAESQNLQGLPQKGQPTFNVESAKEPVTASAKYPAKLVDPATGTVTTNPTVNALEQGTNKVIGTYTIVPETGEVTFTPNKDFKGIPAPATISADVELTHDKNGNVTTKTLQATYSPTIIPVTPTATPSETIDIQGAEQSKEVTFTAGKATVNNAEVEVPMNNNEYKLLGEDGQPAESVPAKNPAGEVIGTYTLKVVDGKPTAVFTPTNKLYSGEVKPVTIQGKDTNGTAVTTTYTPRITPVVPTGTPVATEGVQGATQEGTPTFTQGNDKVPMKIDADQPAKLVDPETGNPTNETTIPAKDETGKQVGTYTIEPTTGKVTFTPNKDFAGTPVPATVEAKDANGTPATAKYTPTVKGATPTATPSETVDIQGAEQSKEVTFIAGKATVNGEEVEVPMNNNEYKLLGEDGQPAESVPAKNPAGEVIGTYTLKVVDGKPTAVFTPTNKLYSGEVKPVTIQGKDTNGTAVTTTYTPRITPVVPTGTPVATEGVQGATQEGTPTFTQGNDKVPMKIDADQPAKLVDPETGNPTNETTIPAKDETGKQVGTYTIEPTTGKVTFTPNKDFAGTPVPATVEAKDANGTPATAKYTPTVKGATPTATPSETVDIQGAEQSKEVTFIAGKATVNGEEVEVPMNNNEYKLLGEDGQPAESVPAKNPAGEVIGTYTLKVVDGKPTAVFTPTNKLYSGEVKPVTIQGKDTNGTAVTTTYTPRITPVVPTGTPVATEGVQGATQEGTPTFKPGNPNVSIDEEVAPTLEGANPEGKVVVPGEGTYTVDKDGKVTFTPEPQFTGTAKGVTVKRVDKNGTPVTATYTPTVTPVTPEGTPAETTGIQGATQEGTPTFKPGNPNVPIDEEVAPTLEGANPEGKVVVPGEGTYTVDKDGKVTFTPEPQFTGTAKGVTVKRVDKNGTPVTATYTPTVTPVTPTGKNAETEGPKAQPQTSTIVFDKKDEDNSTVNFNKGHENVALDPTTTTLVGKDGKPTTEVKVPGEGTYTLANNVITFTPERDFVGKASGVTVQVKDANGTKVEKTYTPTVRPVTTFVDEAGNPITVDKNNTPVVPEEDGTLPKKDIHGYVFKETKKDEKGNTIHVYQKVSIPRGENESTGNNTSKENKPSEKGIIRDKDGNPIPGFEYDRMSPILDIPEYVYVETVTDPDGTVRHIYRPIETVHKDKDGNPIPNVASKEKGAKESKVIPGYRLVGTKKLPNGDVEHIYEKVQATTTWVDEHGNVIQPMKEGLLNPSEIPGYEFVRTETDANGNVRHVYRRIATSQATVKPSTTVEQRKNELPNTGTGEEFTIFGAAVASILAGLGIAIPGKKKEEE